MAAVISPLGDLAILLAAADRQPDPSLGAADDLRGRELSVGAELLLRGVHAYRFGLGLDLGDLLDLAVLQRLAKPRLGPLAGLHDRFSRVGGTFDHVRVGGQRQHSCQKVHLLLARRRKKDFIGLPTCQNLLIDQENRHCDRQIHGGSPGKAMARVVAFAANVAALGYRLLTARSG